MEEQPGTTFQENKQRLVDAYDRLVASEQERPQRDRPPPPPREPVWKWAFVGVAWLALLYIWLGRPAWLFTPERATRVVDAEASLRFAIYLQRERVVQFYRGNGHLPANLDQTVLVEKGLSYQPLQDSVFVLRGREAGLALGYRSNQPIHAFMGDTFQRLGISGTP